VGGDSHVQALRNPCQRHRGLAPQPRGNPDLTGVALPPRPQLLGSPTQTPEPFPKNALGLGPKGSGPTSFASFCSPSLSSGHPAGQTTQLVRRPAGRFAKSLAKVPCQHYPNWCQTSFS